MSVRFAGYAAVFGHPDRSGDVIHTGAFQRSLREHPSVPLFWQHDSQRPIGTIERLEEDERGLRVIAGATGPAADRIAALAVTGLSFGYRIREAKPRHDGRDLIHLDLVEVSVVDRPMHPSARIHAVQGQSGEQTGSDFLKPDGDWKE